MKKSMFLCLLLLAVLAGDLPAREVTAKDAAALRAALGSSQPGDTIILAPGEWKDAAIEIGKGGAEGSPLTIRAQTPGETLLTGSSALKIKAPHVVVDGLYFTRGCLPEGDASVVHFLSHHGTLKNTAIIDFNPGKFESGYYWVFFEGDDNLVERCYFKGKNNMQPLLGNAVTDSRRNTVRACYFKNIPHADGNGREILRMWGPGKFDPADPDGAYCVVEGNLFDHADGEGTEIVSLKSNHNRLVGNTVVATRGCFNIRQGSHNTVAGNIILGAGVTGAQGLRMSGTSNVVKDNVVAGCDWGIKVMAGEYIERALTADYKPTKKNTKNKGAGADETLIAKYPQVKDLSLLNNLCLGNSGPDLEIGFGYKKHWPKYQMVLLPENCRITGNRFIRPQGGESVIGVSAESSPPLDQFHFEPNQYLNNILLGGTVAYAPAAEGFKVEKLPSGWSEKQELAKLKPLTASDVGPQWVIALRSAGRFPAEDDKSCYRSDSAAKDGKDE